jgi:hypothetical protein
MTARASSMMVHREASEGRATAGHDAGPRAKAKRMKVASLGLHVFAYTGGPAPVRRWATRSRA